MSLRKISFLILSVVFVFTSCDEDDNRFRLMEPFDFEQNVINDNDSIVKYLNTHYYNSSELENNPRLNKIKITKVDSIPVVPEGSTLLIDNVEVDSFLLNNFNYKYYTLKISQGAGENAPTFADNVLVAFEESRLPSNALISSALNPNPLQLDLRTSPVIGLQLVLPKFNTADSAVNIGDGTTEYSNPGVGVMFLPAGLRALFRPTQNNTPDQTLITYKFELLKSFENDQDNDGIPSYLEEISGNQLFNVSEDDTDQDGIMDFLDDDDDNDGIPTSEEIVITTENRTSAEMLRMIPLEVNQVLLNEIKVEDNGTFTGTVITFTDTDGDNIPDYLDAQ